MISNNKLKFIFNELPNSYNAEKNLLGCFLYNTTAFYKIYNLGIRATDFYYLKHKIIFDIMLKIYLSNKKINLIVLIDYLIHMKKIKKIGGFSYIIELISLFPSLSNIEAYSRLIINKSILRTLIKKSMLIIYTAMFSEKTTEEIVNYANYLICSIVDYNRLNKIVPVGYYLKTIIEMIIKQQKREILINGKPSGFIKLDNLTNGFHNGELIILAARPSMGKTAMALNIATFMCLELKYSIVFFSFEMSTLQLVQRIISSESKIDLFKIRTGNLTYQELMNIIKISKILGKIPLYIDDACSANIDDLCKCCRKFVQKYRIQLIFIDYLQLLYDKNIFNNKAFEISNISKKLKSIGKELNIPIIILSQLNRNVETRYNKKPMMSDLRESGAIEQDADLIIFLYRDEYYLKQAISRNKKGLTDIILAKNRNGPIGKFYLKFFGSIVKFVNLINA